MYKNKHRFSVTLMVMSLSWTPDGGHAQPLRTAEARLTGEFIAQSQLTASIAPLTQPVLGPVVPLCSVTDASWKNQSCSNSAISTKCVTDKPRTICRAWPATWRFESSKPSMPRTGLDLMPADHLEGRAGSLALTPQHHWCLCGRVAANHETKTPNQKSESC